MCSNNMRTLSMRRVTYLIEYLGEFEFIFETILDYESGDQLGSFDAKNPPSKISCLGTFLNLQFLAIIFLQSLVSTFAYHCSTKFNEFSVTH